MVRASALIRIVVAAIAVGSCSVRRPNRVIVRNSTGEGMTEIQLESAAWCATRIGDTENGRLESLHLGFRGGDFGGLMHVAEPGNRDAGYNAQHQYNDYQFDQRESASHPTSVYQLFSPEPLVFGHTSPVATLYAHPPRVPTVVPLVTPVTTESAAESGC